MKKNLGNADRIIRLVIAGICALLWFQNIVPGTWGNILLGAGALLAFTGLVSFCPIYKLLGLNSITSPQK